MHNLPKVFAVWRLQANTVAGILSDREHYQQAKQLRKILKQLDEIWMEELGEPYVNELIRLIELTKGSTASPASTATNGEKVGTVVPFRLERGRP